MKGFTKSLDHFGRELRVQGINLAGLPRSEVNNQKRDHHHEEEGDYFLYDASADKRQHKKCLKLANAKGKTETEYEKSLITKTGIT